MSTSINSQRLFDDYRGIAGVYDDCSDGGRIRPSWQPVLDHLSSLGAQGLSDCDNYINRLIRENSIALNRLPANSIDAALDGDRFTSQPTAGTEGFGDPLRPWRLSPIPMVLDESSWRGLERGLEQRTLLLETILEDLLGPQRLLQEKVVPPSLLWSNPFYHRVYRNLPCPNRFRIQLSATDVFRTSKGEWLATGDRTRAPSGIGYLLENRIIMSRAYPDLIRSCHTARLATFFDNLRMELRSIAPRVLDNPRIVILTPGENSYREFEDAYLSRYLGFTLVQGRDLAVRGSQLFLKTLGGLLPIDVVLRHVSDRKCDPLELEPQGDQGVSGLLHALRSGEVAIANAIGSSLAETPGLIAFLEAAAKFFWGSELSLGSVRSYWCGVERDLKYVLDHLDELSLRPAFRVTGDPPIFPAQLAQAARDDLIKRLRAEPEQFVAQEKFDFGTTPIWQSGSLDPWYAILRCFQLRAGEEIQVLPGALSRLSRTDDDLTNSPLSGQLTQDCWISLGSPEESGKTLLPPETTKIPVTRTSDELPSRVAEHFFWLGRYAERGEAISRLLRTTLACLDGEVKYEEPPQMPKLMASLAAAGQIETAYGVDGWEQSLPKFEEILRKSLFDKSQPLGLINSVGAMFSNATAVRDRLSLDTFRILQELSQITQKHATPLSIGGCIERLDRMVHYWCAFAGVVAESTTRTHGWRILEVGRRLERGLQLAEFLHATLVNPIAAEPAVFESVLEATDSLMTYRSRYVSVLQSAPTIDLLVTDETNPRSLKYQCLRIVRLLSELQTETRSVGLGREEKTAEKLASQLRLADAEQLAQSSEAGVRESLGHLLQDAIAKLPQLSDEIVAKYLIHSGRKRQFASEFTLPFPS